MWFFPRLSLALAFIVVLSNSQGTSEFPCPDQSTISPCICTNTDSLLELECSQVTSEEELISVFTNGDFSVKDFHKFFLIHNSATESTLNVLIVGTFNDISFEMIEITGTSYSTVESNVFSNMTSTLDDIKMSNNEIVDFPFNDLESLTLLTRLDLRNNFIVEAHIPMTVLEEVFLQDNSLNDLDFSMSPTSSLQNLELDNNNFQNVPDLAGFDMLNNLAISYNSISSLENDTFVDQKIKLAILDYNILESIHRDTFAGHLAYDAIVDMVGNQFLTLDEEDWKPFLNELTLPGSLDLSDNPLLCGCDVAWLFIDGGNALSKITQSTTCSDGRYLHSLDPEVFVQLC